MSGLQQQPRFLAGRLLRFVGIFFPPPKCASHHSVTHKQLKRFFRDDSKIVTQLFKSVAWE